MACKECEDIDNYNCQCEEQYCNCKIKLSTVCVLYDGVVLSVLDTYEGENLESILKKIDELFGDIFNIFENLAYRNLGSGAEVFKRVTSNRVLEFRTLLGSQAIQVQENLNEIGITLNEQWLFDFISNAGIETITTISNTITGKRIATYTNEAGVQQNINETITSLVDNNNGTFTYTNENGVGTTYNVSSTQTLTSIANTVIGKRIATYTNENGTVKDINETITNLSNTSLNTFQYTNENGVITTYVPANASSANKGIVEKATQAETDAGTDDERYVSPKTFLSSLATETKTGVLEVATQTEANGLSLDNKIITPAKLPIASTTQIGLSEIATQLEVDNGTDTTKYVTPATLNSKLSSSGIFSESFEYTAISWSRYSNIIVNHGMTTRPKIVQIVLVAKSTVDGYEIGEEINLDGVDTVRPDSPQWMGVRCSYTNSQIKLRVGNYIVIPTGTQASRELIDSSINYSIKIKAFS